MKTCLMNMCARHVPYTCKNEIEWYITCLSTMVCCSSVFVVTNVLYIARILPYVSVYTHVTPTCACPLLIQVYVLVNMLLACTRMLLLHVYGMYWYVTHILLVCTQSYVLECYLYVLICYLYVLICYP